MSEHVEEVQALLSLLDNTNCDYNEKEEGFVEGLRERLEQYGSNTYVSDKQLFWLRDIKGKYVDGIAPGPCLSRARISDDELYKRRYPASDMDDDLPF